MPRTDTAFIERGKTLDQALSLALRSGFSRIPVTGESTDDIVGIAYLKDMVAWMYSHRERATSPASWRRLSAGDRRPRLQAG